MVNPWWIASNVGTSGSCNIPVECGLERYNLTYAAEKQAVMQMLINGPTSAALCTGTLLNTADGRNVVITAHHCFMDGPKVADPAFTAFAFNFEADCATGIVTPVTQILKVRSYV